MIVRLICCLAIGLCWVVSEGIAKTVVWSVKPAYEAMKPYSQSLYLCQLHGKWGIVDVDGRIILPNQYDFITSQQDGIGLFGVVEDNKNRLDGFIRSNGACTFIHGKFYVIPTYPYFSEGKLCVSDLSGKQGFIDESGNLVIKCQFDVVRPFKEGLSSIKKGPWVYYIRENYDAAPEQNVVYAEWRNGQITEGSSFKNGEAVVGYGNKYKVIDQQGRELRNFNASRWRINPLDYTIAYNEADLQKKSESSVSQYSSVEIFSVEGKYGFRLDGGVILYPVLSNASPVDVNQVSIVTYNGKVGLLKVIDESVSSLLLFDGNRAERIHVTAGGKTDMLQYAITLPAQYAGYAKFLVDKGDGIFEDVSSSVRTKGKELVYGFYPKVGDKEETKKLRCRLLYDGMEVLNKESTLAIERPVRLRLSEPFVTTVQADIKTEIQEVSATIFNDSERDVTVTATLSVACHLNKAVSHSNTITIPGKSSKSIRVPVTVKSDENVSAVIRLSSGEQKNSTVALKIY